MANQDSWNPDQYHRFQNERSQPFFDLIALVKPRPRMTIVDLGSGTGELTAELHQKLQASTTVGIDNSEAMLDKARQFAHEGLTFQRGEIEKFGELDKFDLVFSNAALQWCADHEILFGRLTRSLKASGQLAVQMPVNHDYPTHVIADQLGREEPFRSALKAHGGEHKTTVLAPERYAEILYDLGFREQQVFVRVYGHILTDRAAVVEWVKGTLLTYYQSRLSADLYAEFLREFRTRLFAELRDTKPFFYPFKRLFLWGSR